MSTFLKYLLLIAFAFVLPATAGEITKEEEIKQMMIKKSDTFFAIMADKSLEDKVRKEKVLDEIGPLFDFKLMSRLALNKKIWKSLTKAQRKEFSEVFVSRIQASYLSKLDIFADVEVEIGDSVRIKKNRIELTALIKTKADTKKLVYKFYQTKKKKWLIYDISVVGVSFLQSYRAQYSSYLKEHSFEELIEKLKVDPSTDETVI